MKRILFQALAVLSLILFAATLVVWLRSYWREDIATTAGLPAWSGYSTMGSVTINHTDAGGNSSEAYYTIQKTTPTWTAIRQHGLGFHYGTHTEYATLQMGMLPPITTVWRHYKSLTLPYWIPALLFTGLPAWWLFLYRRRRPTPGLCPACRYDLRAHAPGQKCPECGTVIATPPAVLQSHP
jgi:hypothetical protein